GENVFVLDGGLRKWKAEGRPLESGAAPRKARSFRARKPPAVVATLADVQAALASKTAQVVDSRPGERFTGEAAEPRPGVRRGHIPGSLSVPSSTLVVDGKLLPPDKIKAALVAGGVELGQPVSTRWGSSGVGATLWLSARVLG